ncbi:unnamed protein product [Tilletia controversa]|nr:unnamed protein product [Tilletia controversa]
MSSSSSESAAQETQTQSQGEALSQAPPASATQAGQRKENCFWASTEDEKLLDVLEEGKQQGKASGGGFKVGISLAFVFVSLLDPEPSGL